MELKDHWRKSGNIDRPWGCGSFPSDQDAVFSGVRMCADRCVTRMKGLNSKNSIKQEDKQLLIKHLILLVFLFWFTSYFEISFNAEIYIYLFKFYLALPFENPLSLCRTRKFSFLLKDMTDSEGLFSCVCVCLAIKTHFTNDHLALPSPLSNVLCIFSAYASCSLQSPQY